MSNTPCVSREPEALWGCNGLKMTQKKSLQLPWEGFLVAEVLDLKQALYNDILCMTSAASPILKSAQTPLYRSYFQLHWPKQILKIRYQYHCHIVATSDFLLCLSSRPVGKSTKRHCSKHFSIAAGLLWMPLNKLRIWCHVWRPMVMRSCSCNAL